MQDKETKINNLRKKIDDIDSQMIELINLRTEIVCEIPFPFGTMSFPILSRVLSNADITLIISLSFTNPK